MQAVNKPTWTEEEVWKIITIAREWIDVPWVHQGRSRNGVDCIGLFYCVSLELGRPIKMPSNYTHEPDPKVLMAAMEELFDRVTKKEMAIGDFVLMRFEDRHNNVSNRHVALVTNLGIIHSAALYRKVTEHGLDEEFRNRIEMVYRMRRVAE
jgi:cell wall-associated NlpC family hydrolase